MAVVSVARPMTDMETSFLVQSNLIPNEAIYSESIEVLSVQANVEMMAQYLPLSSFKTIYVVDLCASLCDQARKKVIDNKWNNVKVVEGDACTFAPTEGKATLVTFSYSLSSAPLSLDSPSHSFVGRSAGLFIAVADGLEFIPTPATAKLSRTLFRPQGLCLGL